LITVDGFIINANDGDIRSLPSGQDSTTAASMHLKYQYHSIQGQISKCDTNITAMELSASLDASPWFVIQWLVHGLAPGTPLTTQFHCFQVTHIGFLRDELR
jgi:hypothetical protein